MGNCCDGGDSLEITSAKNGTAQATSYGPRHSEHAAPGATTRDGHQRDAQNVRMTTTTTAPPQNANPAGVPPDFQLQAPLGYPGDARGVYYQPEGPSAVLSQAFFEDKDSRVPQSVSEAATAAAAAVREATTQAATVVTSTVTSTAVAVVSQPEPAPVDTVTSASPQRQRSANYQPRDVMISYSRTDGDVMVQIREQLEVHGFSVWVDENSIAAGADFLSKIGEAIIDAKFFICILSEKAVRSKYCRDEVALAYVSNTAIFPVNLQLREHLLPLMDTGLKLQLSNYNWTSLTDPATRADNVQALISAMKSEMDDLDDQPQTEGGGPGSSPSPPPPSSSGDAPLTSSEGGGVGDREVTSPSDVAVTLPGKDVKVADKGGSPVQSPTPTTVVGPPDFKPMRKLRERNRAVMMLHGDDDVSKVMPEQFWNDQFGVVDYVTWDRFTSTFLQVFKKQVEATFTSEDQQQLLDILKRELEVGDDERIYKYQLTAFCSVYGDMLAVWPRVQEQARESFAMREVFNMDSSVRVEAIENLGKFRSAAVIDALRDLLTDPDANVRAVATVSLSRTNADDPVTIRHILRTLSDKDRLVREAGCLALGHLRARQAISKLSHLWRNDVISHVRDAAAVALRQIGGQEVEDVMRVTKVLAEEIRSLTEVQA